MEECHLHHGVNTRSQTALARDFGRINHIETGFLLIQDRLNFLRQTRPDFIHAVRGIEQENTARLQTLGHLIFIDKLQLMAADKISLRYQIRGTDRLLTDAQVRNGQATCFFRVIDEIALRVPRRGVTDNLDIVFGGRHATVTAQTVEQRFELRGTGQGVFWQG